MSKRLMTPLKSRNIIAKLEPFCLRNEQLTWFSSYFTNRKQCYKVSGKRSNVESTTCGVPRGSCLGPLLFISNINDLYLDMKHCDVIMYVDDTSLMFASDYITLTTA